MVRSSEHEATILEASKKPFHKSRIFLAGAIAGGALIGGSISFSSYAQDTFGGLWENAIHNDEVENSVKLDITRPTPETISNLQENIVRIITSIKPSYQHYGFFGSNCTGLIIKEKGNKLGILSAKHCFPKTITTKDSTVVRTTTKAGESIIQAQATNLKGESVEVTPFRYFDIQDEANHTYDILYLGIKQPNDLKNAGTLINEAEPLKTGQHLTLLSIDSYGNKFTNSLFYIGESKQGTHLMLAFEKLDETCAPGQSGSGIFDNSGALQGIFTETSKSPFLVNSSYAKEHNLPSQYIGKKARECYAVSLSKIRILLNN